MPTALTLFLAAALTAPTPAPVTTVVPLSFSELCQAADTIVVGTVAGAECRHVDGKRTIKTFVTLRDLAVTRGTPGNELVLQFEGGHVGDDWLKVPGMPELAVGRRYLLFVAHNGGQPSPIVGFWQGAFEVTTVDRREVLVTTSGQELLDVRDDRLVLLAAPPRPRPARAAAPDAIAAGGRVVPAHTADGAPCQLAARGKDHAPLVLPREQDPGTRLGVADVVRRVASIR